MADNPPPYEENPPAGPPPSQPYQAVGGDYPQSKGFPQPAAGVPQPQGAGYPPQQPNTVPPTATTVLIGHAPLPYFGESPVAMTCPSCHSTITTATHYQTGLLTWLAVGGIALVCWAGCCLIPFCVNECKDVVHTCPACRIQVGKYSRLR